MAYRLIKGALKLIVALRRRGARRRLALLARDADLFRRRAARAFGRDAGLARRLRRAAHLRRDDERRDARALGWLHASERLYQMEIQRRVGQGRIAEIAGPDLIGVDRFIRTLGFYRLAESSFAALSPVAGAAAGLCRRRQRVPRHATTTPAAGIHDPRRQAGALEAGRLARSGAS